MLYTCSITIDVDADSPEAAAKRAWELLAGPEAMLPVVEVFDRGDFPHDDGGVAQKIDLQELKDVLDAARRNRPYPPAKCDHCGCAPAHGDGGRTYTCGSKAFKRRDGIQWGRTVLCYQLAETTKEKKL